MNTRNNTAMTLFCDAVLNVLSRFAIISLGKKEREREREREPMGERERDDGRES